MEPITRRQFMSHLGRCAPALGLVMWPGCHLMRPQPVMLPRVLSENPALDDITRVVNTNTARVQSLVCTDARISSPVLPISLQANVAMVRPKKFRLQASTGLTGTEVDVGSNDQIFWFWFRREQPPYLYHCRHDQFAQSAAHKIMPVEPHWLIEAFGLVTFETYENHQGPFPVGSGRLEIRTQRATATGTITKITRVHEASGAILEQHVYDGKATLLASAVASNHQTDPTSGAILPRQIDLSWPATQMNIKVLLNDIKVNSLDPNATGMFEKPTYEGWTDVDLANPNLMTGARPTPPLIQPAPQQQGYYQPQAPVAGAAPAWNQPTGYGHVAPAAYQQQSHYTPRSAPAQGGTLPPPPLPLNTPVPTGNNWRASR